MDSPLGSAVLSRHTPPSWSIRRPRTEVLKELPTLSPEFISVKDKIRRYMSMPVHQVFRVENPYLFGSYLLKKEEYVKRYGYCGEMDLFHATDIASIPSITSDNLDWRRSVRTKFGRGVSFSPDAAYANTYCKRSNVSRDHAMIIAKVLFRSTCEGNSAMILPTGKADTSTGNAGRVYVKYNDNEFYPEYVAYYRRY